MDYFRKPWVIAVLILVVAFIGYWWLAGGHSPEPESTPLTNVPENQTPPPADGAGPPPPEPMAPGAPPPGTEGGTATSPLTPVTPTQGSTELSPAQQTELETLLRQLQFDPGPVDGQLDDQTRSAIRAYQQASGLPETGEPSRELLEELREVVAGSPPTAPTPPTNEGTTPPAGETPPSP